MGTKGKPEITAGQSLDVQPGVSNIGENQATLEALRNANIDGQDTYPTSVNAQRISSGDIDVSGLVRSGTMLVGSGGVTVTSDDDGGTPATGLTIGSSSLYLIKAGVNQVSLDGTTGDATFIGTVTATAGSFPGSLVTGYLSVGPLGIDITSEDDGAEPATGIHISGSKIRLIKAGVDMITLDGTTGDGTFKGAITASTIAAMDSVNFGTDITINGDILLQDSATTGYLRFDGPGGKRRIGWDSATDSIFILNSDATAEIIMQVTSDTAYAGNYMRVTDSIIKLSTNAGGSTTADMELAIGTAAGNSFTLKRGTTTVVSFAGDASLVTFTGDIKVNSGPTITSGTAAPGSGTWAVGDWCIATNVAAGGSPGWVCTTAGSPGTWKAMSNVAA